MLLQAPGSYLQGAMVHILLHDVLGHNRDLQFSELAQPEDWECGHCWWILVTCLVEVLVQAFSLFPLTFIGNKRRGPQSPDGPEYHPFVVQCAS